MAKKIAWFFCTVLLASACVLCACAPDAAAGSGMPVKIPKADMDEAKAKLSTDLLQLIDDAYLPEGRTKDQVIAFMQEQGQIKELFPGNDTVTGAYVYIKLQENEKLDMLDAYVLSTENRDEENKIAACWVDIQRLKEVAALPGVKSIKDVVAPATRS